MGKDATGKRAAGEHNQKRKEKGALPKDRGNVSGEGKAGAGVGPGGVKGTKKEGQWVRNRGTKKTDQKTTKRKERTTFLSPKLPGEKITTCLNGEEKKENT